METNYLYGEVELVGQFEPDVDGYLQLVKIERIDLSFKIKRGTAQVHIDVSGEDNLTGKILASLDQIEAIFKLQDGVGECEP